jgi:magnesium transporter
MAHTTQPDASPRLGRTAGDLMVAAVPRIERPRSVAEVSGMLSERAYDDVSVVAIVEDNYLRGLAPAEELLRAPATALVSSLAQEPRVSVCTSTPIEHAAEQMIRAQAVAIAVTDAAGRFLGLVPNRLVTEALLLEHDEDLARIGGYRSSARRARRAAEEPLGRRLWHRLPWLIVGLAGAMASAVIVGAFEEQLERVVLLAFFVPAVVYIADSVGTQTETLLIRALASDVDLASVVPRELLTGVALGTTVAALFYPFALIGWGDADVALAVSLALLCSCSIATAVAMALPITLRRLGFDPAFGSGPLATVIQDLLSIAIYFAIAVPIAT